MDVVTAPRRPSVAYLTICWQWLVEGTTLFWMWVLPLTLSITSECSSTVSEFYLDVNVPCIAHGHLGTTWLRHKQMNVSKRLSYIYLSKPFSKSIHKTNTYAQTSNTNFEELVLLILPLLKEHIQLGEDGIVDHSVWFIDTRLKTNIKMEWTETIRKWKR